MGGIGGSGTGNIITKNNITGILSTIHINGADNVIYANRITDGIGIAAKGYNNTFYANHVENNTSGATIGGYQSDTSYEQSGPRTSNTTLYHNNFINNRIQVWTSYPVYGTDYFDNGKEGNYWSDYRGEDANGDGVGDEPYVIDYKRKDNFPLMTPFDIDSLSIELPGWEAPTFELPQPTPSEPPKPTPSELPQPPPFPTALVAVASGVSINGVAICVFYYRKKRHH